MTRAPIDPDMTQAEYDFLRQEERYESPEPPRLDDPPSPVKTCGGCEWYEERGSMTGLCQLPEGPQRGEGVFADDEACEKKEGSE